MLTQPYVTVSAFRAHPTYLDTLSLRPGIPDPQDQDAELFNILLMASAKADNYCELSSDGQGTLSAHTRVEQTRVRVSRDGAVKYKPDHQPVTGLTKLEWGTTPANLTTVSDLTGSWVEKTGQIAAFIGWGVAGLGPAFQFGTPPALGELYTRWTYTAGFANTTLTASSTVGAATLVVADPAGILPGTVLRIWEPAAEEAVTVAAGYVPGATTVALAGTLRFAHTVGAGISGMPVDIHQAVIFYGAALLIRPDSEAEDSFPHSHRSPNTQDGAPHGAASMVYEAEVLLNQYRRTR